ncbi:Rho GTPase-activating protein gacFF [Phytophthora nicotianae]|uniref:Rho GTPase-activating protein gacFF n=1 Tax=Phytophthora nicotianae TaxID=4792 RepID=A0A0W8CVG6_PHYNI|nr:Rho GTPase-activating protein gacFF [Phytophthora nicotianae]KUF87972.1 Rho GTPase-activating protein gacFF [Phytophthora nicotianae]
MIDAEGAAETLTAKATQSGFLRKQADNEPGAWNEYYFVIKPLTYLFYYNTKDDETPRGIIDLEYLTDIKRNADCLQRAVGGGDNCFRVSGKLPRPSAEQTATGDIPKMRPLYLDTEDADAAEKWMNAIRNHRFSAKKDEQFFEMVHQLRDAELRVAQLEEDQQREAETKRNLSVKAKTLLQKMRAVDSGNTDELPEVNADDLDDTADDMLAMLEGMEDVLVNLQAKLDQQKQEKKADTTGTTSTRRGFAQVIQRAVSRRENTSFLELSEDEEEETLAAIRSRRQRKPQPPEKPVEKSKQKSKEKVQEEAPALDNVSDVLAMWKAKKKKKDPSSRKQSAPENDDDEDSRRNRNRALPRTTTPDTAKYKKSRGSDRSSEEDTVSLDSSDDRDSGEKLPPGWTKHESRGYPGTYYYAHESVDIYPDTNRSGTEYMSEYETDGEETAGGTTSAAYRKNKPKPKPKSAWAFKLPKLLPTNTTQAAPTEAAASISPIRRAANNHEF